MRNHFNEEELAPSCERGRLEKGSLLFLIILHFTPLLSPPLLLPPLKFSVESLSAGHASPVTWCLKYTTRMVGSGISTSVDPQFLKYHIKKPHILHRCSSQYALWLHCWKNQDCVQDTVRLYPLSAGLTCHVVFKRYNKINHTMNY